MLSSPPPPPNHRRPLTRLEALEALGRTIYVLRKSRRWTQAELGRRARPASPIHHTSISEIEKGKSNLNFTTLHDIVAALGSTIMVVTLPSRAADHRIRRQLVAQLARSLHTNFETLISLTVDEWQKLVTEQQ